MCRLNELKSVKQREKYQLMLSKNKSKHISLEIAISRQTHVTEQIVNNVIVVTGKIYWVIIFLSLFYFLQ